MQRQMIINSRRINKMSNAVAFDPKELDDLLLTPQIVDPANSAPPVPDDPVCRPGDLWLCAPGRREPRVLCEDATNPAAVTRLLGDRRPEIPG
jgi:hypothetical protein